MFKINEIVDVNKKRPLIKILILISIIMFFINPLVGLLGVLFCLNAINHLNDRVRDLKNINTGEQFRVISTMLNNCETFLASKTIKKELTSDSDLQSIDLANDILNMYLNTGIIFSLPDSVRHILINILQDDLQSNSENLDELLALAREQVSLENLKNELKLTRNLMKNDDF